MPDFDVIQFFAQYAYEPMIVYGFIVLFMTASSFGLPIPEEMTLVSAGLVAHMARNPDIYPPPTPGAEGVDLILLSTICFVAVLGSDVLIYFLGRIFGKKLIRTKFFNTNVGQARFNKINKIFQKYSFWASGIFRFLPGIRFPGHMSCGLMGIPLWKFMTVDGIAALVSVPTQVILVAFYGDVILEKFKEFKLILLGIIGTIVVVWLLNRLYHFIQGRRAA
jgi:membrane protein DedA with SNARE-associated domain